ncbi:MAG: hypothetical protein IJ745_04800, partial [Bacteroidales bacterium]|nr:hypothetical protein [Bacteroidales bacterium]
MTKKPLFHWLLAAMLLLPTLSRGQVVLTVADGTATENHIPFYGYYADYDQHVQVFYPDTMLENMTGSSISKMTFYAQSPSNCLSSGSFVVSLAVVDNFSGFTSGGPIALTDAVTVYSGALSITGGGNQLEVVFSEPFPYLGGDLMLDIVYTHIGSDYEHVYFYGLNQSSYTSTIYYNSGSYRYRFTPKTTFEYNASGSNVCYRPNGLYVSGLDSEEATLHWTDRNSGSAYAVYLDGEEVTTVYDTSYTFTNLSQATAYTLGVRAVCGAGDSSSLATTNIVTRCELIGHEALPFVESMEDYAASSSILFEPTCWKTYNYYSGTYPYVVNTYASDGSKSLYFYPGYSYQPQFLVLPGFEDLDDLMINFKYTAATYIKIDVGYMSDPDDTTTFVSLQQAIGIGTSNTNWQEMEQSFVSAPDSVHYPAIRVGVTSSNGYSCYIDEISVNVQPSCQRPSGVSISSIGGSSATVTIHDTTGVGQYSLLLLSSGDTVFNDVVYDTVYTFENLNANTGYNVVVNAVCSDGTITLPVTGRFRTTCVVVSELPWRENFDSYGEYYTGYVNRMTGDMPPCYDWIPQSTSAYLFLTSDSYRYGGQGYSLGFYPGSSGAKNIIVLPTFEEATSGLQVSFVTRSENGSSSAGSFDVGYITDPTDSTTFVALEHYNYDMAGYLFCEVGFASAPDSARIAFRHNGNASNYYWFLDEIDVHLLPSCSRPEVSVSAVNSTTVEVTLADTDNVNHYMLVYSTGSTSDTVDVEGTSQTLANLEGGSNYTLEAYTVCPTGPMTSAVFVNFNTPMESISVPYSTGFEADDDTGWVFFNSHNAWHVGPAVNHGGSQALYISNDNGTSNSYSIDETSMSYAVRTFEFSEAGEYAYSFDWRGHGESSWDYLRAFITPGTAALVGGTLPYSEMSTNDFSSVTPEGWTDIVGGRLNLQSDWQTQTGTFVIANPGIYNLVFLWANDASSGTNPPMAIDNVLLVHLTCPSPANLVLDSVDATSLTFHWTEVGEASSWEVTVDSVATLVTDTFYTVTGLDAATDYAIAVRSVCGAEDTSMTLAGSFRTACAAVTTLPWIEDFESRTGGSSASATTSVVNIPCWDFNGLNGSNTYVTTSQHHEGNQGLRYYGSANYPSYMVLPPFQDNLSDLMFTFWMRSANIGGYVGVGYMTDPSDPTSYTEVVQLHATATNTWEYEEATFPAAATGRIAMRYYGSSYNIYLDDFTVMTAPSCLRPASVTVSNISQTAADIAINDVNSTNHYMVYYTAGSVTDSVEVYDSVYTLTGLTSSTQYSVSVVTLCSDGTRTSATSTTFRTTCAVVSTLPWTEGFESFTASSGSSAASSVTNIPCWDFNGLYGDYTYVCTSQHHEGSNSVRYYGTASYPSYMVLPPFQDDISDLMFTFWMRSANLNGYVGVGYMTNPADPTTYTEVAQARVDATNTWEFKDILFGSSATGRIAMRYYGSSYNIYLDEFTVMTAPSCLRPASVGVSNISQTTADIAINDINSTNHYMVYYTAGSVTDSVEVYDSVYTFTGLTSSTQYSVSVVTLCSDGTRTSATSASFITDCGAITTLPWTEDFTTWGTASDGTQGAPCWTMHFSQSGHYPYVVAMAGQTPNSLVYRESNGVCPIVVLPAFGYNLSDLSLEFYGKNMSGSSALISGYITNPSDRTTFVPVDTVWLTDDWVPHTVSFPTTASGHIAIYMHSNTANGGRLDDITVSLADSTVTPPDPTTYTVSAASADATMGGATVSPSGTVDAGTSVTFTATANSGYHFVAWMSGATQVSTANPYATTVTGNLALTATFDADVVEPTCEAPTNVAASNVTENSAVVGWTAGGTESSWEVEYNGAT